MAVFPIEHEKVNGKKVLTNRCTLISGKHVEVMVGSGFCKHKCCAKSYSKTEVNCGFKRYWK